MIENYKNITGYFYRWMFVVLSQQPQMNLIYSVVCDYRAFLHRPVRYTYETVCMASPTIPANNINNWPAGRPE